MPNKFFLKLVFTGALALTPAHAVEIEGVKVADKIAPVAGGPELVLNGAGVRHRLAVIKVYVGGLYLTRKSSDRDAILADPGAKRVAMHILASEVTAQELISSMNTALANNLQPSELALLEKRLRDLNTMMSAAKVIHRGGVVFLDYIPGSGTRVSINGEEKITIPGEDFFRAMLRIWIGNKPVDGRLRDAMLGGASSGFRLF